MEEAFQVYDLQKSSSCALPLRQGPNQVLTENGETYLAFHHMASERFPLLPPDYGTSSPLKFELVLMLIFLSLSWKRFFLKRYMTSILKKQRLREVSQIQSLYQQFRCSDQPYLDFLQYIHYTKPEQYVLDNCQRPLLLFNESDVTDYNTGRRSKMLQRQPSSLSPELWPPGSTTSWSVACLKTKRHYRQ